MSSKPGPWLRIYFNRAKLDKVMMPDGCIATEDGYLIHPQRGIHGWYWDLEGTEVEELFLGNDVRLPKVVADLAERFVITHLVTHELDDLRFEEHARKCEVVLLSDYRGCNRFVIETDSVDELCSMSMSLASSRFLID